MGIESFANFFRPKDPDKVVDHVDKTPAGNGITRVIEYNEKGVMISKRFVDAQENEVPEPPFETKPDMKKAA
ncbi:MAG: hypothetical protein Q8R36_04340 [bacterium]|nr:hypothetical protein [bacterium]